MYFEQPDITVIMPVYNTELYLRDAINSVINQSFRNWELICINDGSTDNCLKILRGFEVLDNRIIVFDQRNSGRAAVARNVALNHVRGRYVHILDSDDLLSYDCLEKTYEIAMSSNADLVIPDLFFFKDSHDNIINKLIGYSGDRQVLLSSKDAFIASLSWIISGVGLYKTELVKKFRYDETGINGDEYTTRLLLLNCDKIAFSKGIYFYRQHADSTTKKISIKVFDTLLTDFRILNLAVEYKLNNDVKVLCKKKIIEKLFFLLKYLNENQKHFTREQIKEIYKYLNQSFDKIDQSFIPYEGKIIKYLYERALFINFNSFILLVEIRKTLSPIYKNLFKYK